MNKRTSKAFGKKIFLLGTIDGKYVWLEEPVWDCGWYWGFGYVEQYTNHRNPSRARDISMHTHWHTIHEKKVNPFGEMVMSTEEYNLVKHLFSEFYKYKELAESCHNVEGREEDYKHINEVIIPELQNDIIKILTP